MAPGTAQKRLKFVHLAWIALGLTAAVSGGIGGAPLESLIAAMILTLIPGLTGFAVAGAGDTLRRGLLVIAWLVCALIAVLLTGGAASPLIVLLVAAPLASHVPLAALSAILLFVAWNMFEGHQFRRLRQFAPTYRTLMLTTFVLTVVFDLTVAVEVGLVLACLFFIWRMGQLFSATPRPASAEAPLPEGVAVIELYGALFFGAVGKIEALPEQLPAGTRALVLDMQRLVSMDTTGLDALEQLWRTLQRRPVALVLAHVNAQPLSLMRRSGFEALIGPGQIVDDLPAALAPRPHAG